MQYAAENSDAGPLQPADRSGKFSRPEFEDKLNGRLMAQGHGSSDMPVWGPIFTQLGQAPLRMSNLANYVESLQAK